MRPLWAMSGSSNRIPKHWFQTLPGHLDHPPGPQPRPQVPAPDPQAIRFSVRPIPSAEGASFPVPLLRIATASSRFWAAAVWAKFIARKT
jgi:hypothetical protein